MLHEFRVYGAVPGKFQAMYDRVAKLNVRFFNVHEIQMMGFWTDEIGTSNQLTYILTFESMADREKKWTGLVADQSRVQAFAEAEVNGPLFATEYNSFMQATPYSPEPQLSSNLQELRFEHAMPGKLSALNDRFANHTMALFDRHGIESVGYWTELVGVHQRVVYMLGYPSLGDREKSWAAFNADPDWQKVRADSETDGPLVRECHSSVLRLTPWSPR